MILAGTSNTSMVKSRRLSQVLLLFVVVIIQKTGGFLCLPGKRQTSFTFNSEYHKYLVRNDRSISCIYAKRKQKDNRKYIDKDNEDEVDEEMMEGFSEDVKEMLRSSKTAGFLPTENVSDVDDELDNDSQEDIDNDVFKEILSLMDTENDEVLEKDIFDLSEDSDEGKDYVTSFDDVDDDDEESVVPRLIPGEQWKESVQSIIKEVIRKQGLYVQKIVWGGSRIEVVIAASDDLVSPTGPSSSALQLCHRSMYDEFELREEELGVVTRFEIVVASPGIGETLRTDQDFKSFKGFMVAVTTLEIYKKKNSFEGTLVERNSDDVCISLKGRIVKIPRELVDQVRLPKPKYEPTDTEMRKLR